MKLVLREYINDLEGFSPYYIYDIMHHQQEIGTIVLREGSDEEHLYDGHIAYTIDEKYRGHHYAYQACLLLKDKIKASHVLITCDPTNIASKKTIEKLGCTFIEERPIPQHLKKYYTSKEKIKRIYRWELKK